MDWERVSAIGSGVLACLAAAGRAQTLPPAPGGVATSTEFGIQFVTIQGSLGRTSTPQGETLGATSPYRIGRTEITTAQWLPFLNAAQGLGVPWLQSATPGTWGATPSGPGGSWALESGIPSAADVPVWGITWQAAARFCNWLHNGAVTSAAAFENGAYDTSTFGGTPGLGFTDQVRRSDGARFWIPDMDEWTTAAFSSPTQDGQVWWQYPGASNSAPIPGAPGTNATTSSGYGQIGDPFRLIPVGSYPLGMSGWGLLDTSGSAPEWLESLGNGTDPDTGYPQSRRYIMSRAGEGPWSFYESIGWNGDSTPYSPARGFRLAASVPELPAAAAMVIMCVWPARRRVR
jgi:hypothetical protein